jgi:hypothetical protein
MTNGFPIPSKIRFGERFRRCLESVQDLDQGMQRKAKLGEKAQHTGSM